jgi:transketolase
MVHLPSLKPVDKDLILKCAKETKALITVEDHSIYGGLGGLVSEVTSLEQPAKVVRIGMEDRFGLTASLEFQLKHFGISIDNILDKAKKAVNT